MGIYDRDYYRDDRGGPPGPRAQARRGPHSRMWSFNTWLIVINCAIFGLAWALSNSARPVLVAIDVPIPKEHRIEETALRVAVKGTPYATAGDLHQRGMPLVQFVYDKRDGSLVGHYTFQVMDPLTEWGHFSTWRGFYPRLEVWRFVTFQFLHANITHLILNMLGLFFVGSLVEEYLGSKRYAAFYLTAGIFGALMYLVLNGLGYLLQQSGYLSKPIPFLLFHDPLTPLVGASAGIFGVLMAAAFISPREVVLIMGILPMRLRAAVYIFAGIAFFNLFTGSSNAGGEAAHIGGALAGYYFIRHTHLLRDFFDITGDSRGSPARPRPVPGAPPAGEVDRVLRKVHAEGIASLTEAERRTLERDTAARRALEEA